MRTQVVKLVLAALAACTVSGQSQDRVLRFLHTEAAQDMQEIAALMRSITEVQQATVDTAHRTLTVRGTTDRIGLVEWLFNELDRPAPAPPNRNLAALEYKLPGGGDDAVRLFYLAHADRVQDLQEVATLVRSMADIRRLFIYTTPRVLALRAPDDQIRLAEWLIRELDGPSPSRSAAAREYWTPGGVDDVASVFYLAHAETVQNLQEISTLVRSIGDIRRVFTYTTPRVLAVRGTAGQVALAAWLVSELGQPLLSRQGQHPAAYEYPAAASVDNATAVRVFYPAQAKRLQDLATQLRLTTGVRRLLPYSAANALVLRGTASQIALAEKVIREQDR